MSQNNPEMDFNITDLPIPQQFAISDEDIQKIAYAVKSSKLYCALPLDLHLCTQFYRNLYQFYLIESFRTVI
jgi:hypothetical protein